LGEYGYLMDLPAALRAESSPQPQMTEYVWLASGTPARVVKALSRLGVTIQGQQTPSRALTLLNRQGVALGYTFFLLTAVAAAVLVIAGTIVFALLDAGRRSYELAALRMTGISRGTLLRSLIGEQLVVLVPGAVLGVGTGLLGAALALRSIPEFPSLAGGPPLQLAMPIIPLALLVAGLAVALLVGACAAAFGVMRGATYSYLRMNDR
ncbi:MAG: FtsX-like permease family protein, partial [Candidatus Dormibacteria bacterium]